MTQDRVSAPADRAGSAATAAVPSAACVPAGVEEHNGRFGLTRLVTGPWLLLSILGVQALLSLRLVWSNTAFQDEALYLWAGHLEWAHWLHGGPVPDFPVLFSGAPVVYPPLGALANSIGGLAGARILSLCFMLAATALLYSVTKQLFGRGAAIAGSAAFAALGPVQFLGAFATFDALAVLLLALSSWLAMRSGGHRSELWLAGCAVAMALADAAKYTSLLWNPVVIALAVLGSAGAWRQAVSRGIRLAGYTAALIITVLFLAGGHSYVTGIMSTTLSRPSSTVPALRVLEASGKWIGAVALLAIIGAAAVTRQRIRRRTAVAWILAAAVLLAPAEQARIHTIFSLFKHVGFGAWFACIVAGYGLISLTRVFAAMGIRSYSAVLVFLLGAYGSTLSASQFAGWPDSSQMIHDIAPVIERTDCPCLVAESDVVDYYLVNQTTHDIFTTIFAMRYRDDGRDLSGTPAYRAAIRNHYFRLVEIDPSELPAIYTPVVQALSASHYQLVVSTPSNVPGEPFEIWVRSGPRLTAVAAG